MPNPTGRGGFKPGQSGNINGRPKATPEAIDLLARIKSLSGKAVDALESVLDDPNASADAKIKAANIVFDRQLGKPRQEIDQTVTTSAPDVADLRPEFLAKLAALRPGIIAESRAKQAEQPIVVPVENGTPQTGAAIKRQIDDAMREEIKRLAISGQQIEAIKYVRETTGLGLAEAKATVEGLRAGAEMPALALIAGNA